MDFLDTIFLDNTIRSYCIAAGVIVVMLALKRFFSRRIASLLYRLFSRIWQKVSKDSFTDLVLEPLAWLLFIIIAVFVVDKLNFPTSWRYKIYGHAIDDILSKIGIGIIIICFTIFLLRIIDFIALVLEQKAVKTTDKTDDQLIIFFRDFLKVLIVITGILFIVKACFNQPIGNLLTSLSIVGAAVALAAKESLENLIASFIIFFDKPFTVGDTLKVTNITGTIERIGLRSTRLRTADKTLVTVPNKQMVDNAVDNWSMRTYRRAEIKLELAATTPPAAVQKIISTIKEKFTAGKQHITSHSVHLTEVNNSGITIIAEYFTRTATMEEFTAMKENYYFFMLLMLQENKVALSNAFSFDGMLNKQNVQG
jgi:MscS family membrane protein